MMCPRGEVQFRSPVCSGVRARPNLWSMTTDDCGAAVAASNGDGGQVFRVSGCG